MEEYEVFASMKSRQRIFLGLLFCLSIVAPALADSDSFYCVGRGYIAFDLRSFLHPGLAAPHVLRLFRFGSERGIYKAAEWSMTDFQIHGMRCTRDRIVVLGSENANYVFDIADHRNSAPNAGSDDAASSLEGQLGWSVEGVKSLESTDPEHKYRLVLSHHTSGSEVTWTADLLQIDSHQKVTQRALLYERQEPEESGD
jgi:hypothetical protein